MTTFARTARFALLCTLSVSLLNACGKDESQIDSSSQSSHELAATGKVVAPTVRFAGTAPAWGAGRAQWTAATLRVVRARFQDLDRARDVEVFCPGYRQAPKAQKEMCWVFLVAAIAKYESAFKPETSFREPDGNYSIGLMALSPNECPNARSFKELQSAIPNLICGTNRMASLIGKRGNIDGPEENRGASRYWSTLRKPYKYWDASRKKHLNLGKRDLVIPHVRGYRGCKVSGGTLGSVRMISVEAVDEAQAELPELSEEEMLDRWVARERD